VRCFNCGDQHLVRDAEGLVVQAGSSVDHSEEQFDYYESSQFMIVTSKDKSESLPVNAEREGGDISSADSAVSIEVFMLG
jgi:hypothetical protein